MSLLPRARLNRRPIGLGQDDEDTERGGDRDRQDRSTQRGGDRTANAMHPMNSPMIPSAGGSVKRTRAYAAVEPRISAMTRAREPDDDRVDVRPERVVAELDEDVVPCVERRLEVDERHVERALVDLVRRLERGDDQPVDREQDDQRPADSRQNAPNLASGCRSSGERRRNGLRGRRPRRGACGGAIALMRRSSRVGG